MKLLVYCLCFFIVAYPLRAQLNTIPTLKNNSGDNAQCITSAQEKLMKERVKQNVKQLIAEGRMHLPSLAESAAALKLFWPLKASQNFTDSFYYGITNFVDHDPSTGLQDWNCGQRTYDGHNGTDISLWPFPWLMMDNKMVKIVAAADGILVDKHDGEFDRNCNAFGQPANYIILQHANGYQTVYYHCKKGTVTTKAIGASIAKGETIAYVGSSGNSTGVHLHFSVYDNLGNLVDPYKGNCNAIASSLWNTQQPYYGRKMHKIMASTLPPLYPYCPNPEQVNEYAQIPGGINGYFYAFLSETKTGDTVYVKILKPDNSIWQSTNYVYTAEYPTSYLGWAWYLDPSLPKGAWKWKVTLNKKTYTYNFTVTDPIAVAANSVEESPAADNIAATQIIKDNASENKIIVSPNPVKASAQLQFICDAGNYHLEILNTRGQVLQSSAIIIDASKRMNLNVRELPAGVYRLHVYNNQTNLYAVLAIE